MAAILCSGATGCASKASKVPGCCFCDDKSFFYCGSSCCGCGKMLSTLKHICTNPFGVFVTVTVVSNIPPMLIALTEVGNLNGSNNHNNNNNGNNHRPNAICHASFWLLINFLFCWVHIIASFYIAVSINHKTSQEKHKHHRNKTMDAKSIFKRAGHLFCYDPFMAAYIITIVVYVVFLFLPKILDLDSEDNSNNNGGACSIYIHEKVIATVGFAWAFLAFGLGALALSFGFAYVDSNRHRRDKTEGFATALSDVNSEDHYTSLMEEGAKQKNRDSKKASPKRDRPSRQHSRGDDKSGSRGSGSGSGGKGRRADKKKPSPGRTRLDEYIPPMIVLDPTEDGVELASIEPDTEMEADTESLPPQKDIEKVIARRKQQFMVSDTETDFSYAERGGFMSELETENEDGDLGGFVSPASSSKQTARTGHPRRPLSPGSNAEYFADHEEDDDGDIDIDAILPDVSTTYEGETFEVPVGGVPRDDEEEPTETTTTDEDENFPPPSFETMEIDQALDLSDNEESANPLANLDIVLAVSQDPTVSMSLTETDASRANDDGSVNTKSTNGSNNNNSVGGRLSLSSQGHRKRRSRQARSQSPSLPPPAEAPKPKVEDPRASLNDLNYVPTSPVREHRLNMLIGKTRTKDNNEYDLAPLTYSTSIGTLGTVISPNEPLSFVDGGNSTPLPYAQLREQSVLESSDGEMKAESKAQQPPQQKEEGKQ